MPAVFPVTPLILYHGSRIDGADNTTVRPGAIARVKNLGSLGAAWDLTPPGTAPKLAYPNGLGVIMFAGGDILRTATGLSGGIVQPYTVAFTVKRTQAATNVFCDGVGAGGRMQVFDNGGVELRVNAGAVLGTGVTPTVIGKYNLVTWQANGLNATLDLNFQFDGSHAATGNSGTHIPDGITLGDSFTVDQPLQGQIQQFIIFPGLISSQQVHDYISADLSTGWPRTNLATYNLTSPAPTPKLACVGGQRVVEFGNSLTAGSTGVPWVGPLETAMNHAVSAPFTFINKGVGGNTVFNGLQRVQADVIAQAADIVLIEFCENDFFGQTPMDEFLQNMQAVIDAIKFGLPNAKMGWADGLCRGEQVPAPWERQYSDYCNAVRWICGKNQIAYFPMHAMQQTYDAINNVPSPGNNNSPGPLGQLLLSQDGAHVIPNGAQKMSDVAFAQMTFTG